MCKTKPRRSVFFFASGGASAGALRGRLQPAPLGRRGGVYSLSCMAVVEKIIDPRIPTTPGVGRGGGVASVRFARPKYSGQLIFTAAILNRAPRYKRKTILEHFGIFTNNIWPYIWSPVKSWQAQPLGGNSSHLTPPPLWEQTNPVSSSLVPRTELQLENGRKGGRSLTLSLTTPLRYNQ